MGVLDIGDFLNGDQQALSYRNKWTFLIIGDVNGGDQDALSYRNKCATLKLATSTINGNIISDEKFKGETLFNNHKDRISYSSGDLVLMATKRIATNISLGVRHPKGEEKVFRSCLSANKYQGWIL